MQKNENSVKKFYMIFYPGDWLRDMALNSCSLQTQGAWVRLLCHMHESERPGYLILNGKPMDEDSIRKLLSVSEETFDEIWKELTENGVIKKSAITGVFYSKRMVKDFKKYNHNPKADESKEQMLLIADHVLKYLNKKTGKEFPSTDKEYIKLINEKIESGYKLEDFQKVIDTKCDEWLTDKKMEIYLRPSTLFGNKFGDYLNQNITAKEKPKPINPYKGMMK